MNSKTLRFLNYAREDESRQVVPGSTSNHKVAGSSPAGYTTFLTNSTIFLSMTSDLSELLVLKGAGVLPQRATATAGGFQRDAAASKPTAASNNMGAL